MNASDFLPLINHRVVLGFGRRVVSANGTATVDSVNGDVVTLRIGKGITRKISASLVTTMVVFA